MKEIEIRNKRGYREILFVNFGWKWNGKKNIFCFSDGWKSDNFYKIKKV